MAEWLIRITGKQRKDVDLDLVVQAVVALGRQLAEEARQEAERDNRRADGRTSKLPAAEDKTTRTAA
jgi:hypothetical protein